MHRTTKTHDANDIPIVRDVANYKNAKALRKVAEEFIALHLAVDLEIFEQLMTNKE
jgi:hypothetical protein